MINTRLLKLISQDDVDNLTMSELLEIEKETDKTLYKLQLGANYMLELLIKKLGDCEILTPEENDLLNHNSNVMSLLSYGQNQIMAISSFIQKHKGDLMTQDNLFKVLSPADLDKEQTWALNTYTTATEQTAEQVFNNESEKNRFFKYYISVNKVNSKLIKKEPAKEIN